jgi:LPS-assembly lipoprotein
MRGLALIASAALTAAALLAGCGFQMRGVASLPFETIVIPGATGGIALDLKRNIQSGTGTKVVEDPRDAQAVLQFTEEARIKEILSLAATGRVREYRLLYRVGFRVHDGKGGEFVAPNSVLLSRDITFNDSEILAKESEEALLYRDMQFDMVQQVMRRLEAARKPAPAAR